MATHSSILAWRIPMDRGAWRATVHGVTESDRTEVTKHSTAQGEKKKFKEGKLTFITSLLLNTQGATVHTIFTSSCEVGVHPSSRKRSVGPERLRNFPKVTQRARVSLKGNCTVQF